VGADLTQQRGEPDGAEARAARVRGQAGLEQPGLRHRLPRSDVVRRVRACRAHGVIGDAVQQSGGSGAEFGLALVQVEIHQPCSSDSGETQN